MPDKSIPMKVGELCAPIVVGLKAYWVQIVDDEWGMFLHATSAGKAKSIFKPGTKVQWRLNGRDYYGSVIEVIGNPGRTQVRVENVMTRKTRDLQLADITGLVQET